MRIWAEKKYNILMNHLKKKSMDKKLNLKYTHIASMGALLSVVAIGLMTSFSASACVDMRKPGSRFINITSSQVTWIASLPSLSSILGSLLSGYITQKQGRKAVLMYVSVPFLLSWLLIAHAPSISWIYIGRLLSGFCAGICSVAVPAYVIEIATIEARGLLGSCYQVSYTVGVLIAMFFGAIFRWSWLAVTGALFILCASCVMITMPESPAWLISKGNKYEAIKSIEFLKGKNINSEEEYERMLDHISMQGQNSIRFSDFKEISMELSDMKQPYFYKPLGLAIGLVFFQQFSGVNALMAYTVEIFEHAESSVEPAIAAIIIAGVEVLAAIIGSVLSDKVGRRKLYIISGTFVTIGLFILGLHGILVKTVFISPQISGWIPLAGYMIFVASFSLGYGPIPYLMTPELVPVHSRSIVLAISGIFSSLFLFIVTKTFNDLKIFLSDDSIYWVYGFFSLLGCLFSVVCLPETKLKLMSEIQQSFKKPKTKADSNSIEDILN